MTQEKYCDRCNQQTDEYRVQDNEVLCEKCIRQLDRNAQPAPTPRTSTTTTATKATAKLISRTFIVATGIVLYVFKSSRSNYEYYITSKNGVIDTTTHMDCIGFKQHGHCLHMDVVIKVETPLLQAHKAADEAQEVAELVAGFAKDYEVLAKKEADAKVAQAKATGKIKEARGNLNRRGVTWINGIPM